MENAKTAKALFRKFIASEVAVARAAKKLDEAKMAQIDIVSEMAAAVGRVVKDAVGSVATDKEQATESPEQDVTGISPAEMSLSRCQEQSDRIDRYISTTDAADQAYAEYEQQKEKTKAARNDA